jgi:3-hydroxymyristoyl/3-hydroxydecanoyl-(acyl carrier protein) dehydratase
LKPVQPELLGSELPSPGSATLKLRLPKDLLYFEGHFPQAAILPGVTQIDWAIKKGRELFGIPGAFSGMEALKFQQVFQPGDEAELNLEWYAEKRRLNFSYLSAKGKHSSGRILFQP